MYFKEKLKLLMNLFKINNSQLARGINVDASLVSRWKSGQRKISAHSPHVASLASYFIRLNAYQYQKDYLDQLISVRQPGPEGDERARILVLAAWLISDEPPDPIDPGKQPRHIKQTQRLITQIARLLADPEKNLRSNLPAVPSNLQSQADKLLASTAPDLTAAGVARAKPGLDVALKSEAFASIDVEKFRGHTGRRAAVLSFLREVLQSPSPQQLYLFSEDPTDWIMQDPNFAALWAVLMQKVIQAGHKISIIHVIHRETMEIEKMLSYWMPLHLSGRINSYYQVQPRSTSIRQTQFIRAGRQALVSSSVDGDSHYLTLSFRDPECVRSYEKLFDHQLENCRPLFRLYTENNAAQLFADGLAVRRLPGSVYTIRESLNPLSMPEHLFYSIVGKLRADLSDVDWLKLYHSQQASFSELIARERYVDIYPIDLIEKIAHTGQAHFFSSELFMSEPILLSTQDTLAWLDHIIDKLQRHSRYHIVFSPNIPGLEDVSVNISYKESQMALFSSRHMPRNIVIRLDEHHILQGLSYFMDRLYQEASEQGQTDKTAVIAYLKSIRDGHFRPDIATTFFRSSSH